MNEDSSATSWHSEPLSAVEKVLQTSIVDGLTSAEAPERQQTYGYNVFTVPKRWVRVRRLAHQFQDVLIWLLLIAAATSGFVLGAWFDAAAIGAIVVVNAIIGYAQESKAESALEHLKDLEAPAATVIRDGLTQDLQTRDLVPGDLILLEAGDQVPADARLVEQIRLVVSEAALTGESQPVAKMEEPVASDAVIGDRTSMLFAGTTVVSGRGRAIVTAIGRQTEVGHIAEMFSEEQPLTPLQVDLARVGRRLALVAIGAAVVIFGAGLARSFPIETMALTAVALAVAAIPEGLPAVVTVSLAGGLQRMAHRNAIVRRLPAVEALGAVDVICTDKTGTLTAASLQVGDVVLADGRSDVSVLGAARGAGRSATLAAVLCNDATQAQSGFAGDPTEVALLDAAQSSGVDVHGLRSSLPRVDEAGFDGRRKRMSTLHEIDGDHVLLVKGAPEILLDRSSSYADDNGSRQMAAADRARIAGIAENLARGGMRTLGVARRSLGGLPSDPADEEHDLEFIGVIGLRERIRPEVPGAVAEAKEAGVTTVMVTGDHATTAGAVADAVGLRSGKVMHGHELHEMPTDGLIESVADYRVFARVDPADKVKIIEGWQEAGATVAMTGDGVNDAPALHRADIGVAMGSGTDIARESAAMVLTDDNYATIVGAIAEGRRLFSNLRNVVHYLLSANASEVIFVLAGFLFFSFLGEPLLAVQILWINLLSDALPAIALGMDVPHRDLMADRPGTGRNILSARNTALLLTQGLILGGAALAATYYTSTALGLDADTARTVAFSTLVFSQLLHALSVRAAGSRGIGRPGPLLVGALASSALLQLVVVYSAFGNRFFHTEPLTLTAMSVALLASLLSMVGVRVFNKVASRGTPGD